MKSAGYSLIAPFVPVHSVMMRNHCRLLSNIVLGGSTASQKVYSCACKHQLHKQSSTLVARNHPPLFSVAPMMDWTDNHYRTLARLISKHAWLYTEMVVAESVAHQEGNLERFFRFSPEQHPIVLQIAGSNLVNLGKATQLANAYGYDEINFNCGCPSPKVAGHGCFGASLMLDPKFVGEAMSVIAANTDIPVTVKCRIGVDDRDSYNELCDFIYKVSSSSPTKHFILHSRKALLEGLSPAQNRTIHPLKYEYYFGLLRDFPDFVFTTNGGINSIEEVRAALKAGAHGVMVGRAAYNTPWKMLRNVDTVVYGSPPNDITRREVLEAYQLYEDSVLGKHGNNKPNVRDVVKVTYTTRQGKTRLAKYYVPLEDSEKHKVEYEIHRLVVNRDPKFTNFVELAHQASFNQAVNYGNLQAQHNMENVVVKKVFLVEAPCDKILKSSSDQTHTTASKRGGQGANKKGKQKQLDLSVDLSAASAAEE